LALSETLNVTIEFSPKLGVRELPLLDRNHQSNVPGLYIVGDLADAPIIKVALKQGFSVAQHIADGLAAPSQDGGLLDVLVIGAGPAGIGAALALKERGLAYVLIEREAPFATIQNFPKAKYIFSEPKEMVSPGNFWFEDATKEELVERWRAALETKALRIQQPEEVVDIKRTSGVFEVHTRVGTAGLATRELESAAAAPDSTNTYRARRVILAAGKRGQVRTLDVPGETAPHVHHALKDPAEHAGQPVVVVGGGDSAVEAAASLAEAGAEVVLSYRGSSFHRTKARNRERIEALAESGRLDLALKSRPVRISETAVELAFDDPDEHPPPERAQSGEVPARDVFVFIGNKLPLAFLRRINMRMQGDMHLGRALWIASFALLTWCF
jgi:thioredoxin reductase